MAFGSEGVLAIGGFFSRQQAALSLHRADLPGQGEVLRETHDDAFVAMIGRYLDTVLGGAPNRSPGEVGRENLRVVLAAYESARLGREVRLEELAA